MSDHVPSSDAVREGRVNIGKFQYDQMPNHVKAEYLPVICRGGTVMYRWKNAPPMKVKALTTYSKDDDGDGYGWFKLLVSEFMEAMHGIGITAIVEGDDDEEFTYGAFCTALATMGISESDWLLERMFGNVYEIRKCEIDGRDDS